MGSNRIEHIFQKLDAFVKKYYWGQIINRGLVALGLILLGFILIGVLEFLFYFSTDSRILMFYGYFSYVLVLLIGLPGLPLFALLGIRKKLGREDAARMIGAYYPKIADKLLNMIQLHGQLDLSDEQSALILASIDQRSAELKSFSFREAIRLKDSLKTFWYALIPVLFVLLIFLWKPAVLGESAQRIAQYNTHFEKPFGFRIDVLNDSLSTIQHQDFVLRLNIEGDEIPAEIYIRRNSNNYPAQAQSDGVYEYTFRQLDQQTYFEIVAGDYKSETYAIRVFPKPIIQSFDLQLNYPAYTHLASQKLENTGDVTIPEGTQIQWRFYSQDVDRIHFNLEGKDSLLQSANSNVFTFSHTFNEDANYQVLSANSFLESLDTLQFRVQTIADEYPQIRIAKVVDSLNYAAIYFQGRIIDDYGFSKLQFFYQIKKEGSASFGPWVKHRVAIEMKQLEEVFFYALNLKEIDFNIGDELSSYFEIYDNDGVNGPKKTQSSMDNFVRPSTQEIKAETERLTQEVQKKMETALKESRALEEEVQQLREDILSKAELGWQEKEKIQSLLNRKEKIQENLQEAQQLQEELKQQEEQLDALSPEIIQKQKELDQLMEELLSDELKEMMEELQEMMEQMNPEKMAEIMEKIEMKQEELEQNLDRNLEFFKQLEVEKEIEEAASKLEDLAEKQEELAKESADEQAKSEELLKEQEKLNEDFKKWEEDLKATEEKNEALENPHDMPENQEDKEQVKEDMQQAADKLSKSKPSSAKKSQQKAAEKMKSMAGGMMMAMQQQQQEQQAEDARLLRQLLDNLIHISFREENIIHGMEHTRRQDPRFIELMQSQSHLKLDMQMIKDSLISLGRRQKAVRSFIHKEVNTIEQELQKSVKKLEKGRIAQVNTSQQYAMTSMNNLALMLSEVLDQMEQQQSGENPMSGNSSCPDASGKSNSPGKMKDLQKQLGDQLKGMQEAMKKGAGQSGEKGEPQSKKMTESIARMAAQQAEIRQQMQSYAEELKKQGAQTSNLEKALEQADKLEQDLIYKQISQQTLKRQEEILSRLLKEERAELEREKDDRRESKEAEQLKPLQDAILQEFLRKQQEEVELLRTLPIEMRPFYKKKTKAYFFELNSKQNILPQLSSPKK